MKIIEGSWSVVIVGKWNRYILTPEWVGKNIFEKEEIEVEFPINKPELSPRYKSDNIIFLPAIHRCQFIAQEPYDNNDLLEKICILSNKLVKILKYTPLSAIGVNFGFEEDISNFSRLEIFSLNDQSDFSDQNFEISFTEIKRQLKINNKLLNLSLSHNNEKVFIDFNFHYTVDNAESAEIILSNKLFSENKAIVFNMLQEIYDLKID